LSSQGTPPIEEVLVPDHNVAPHQRSAPALDVDPDVAAGALAARRELGTEAESAVIAAFLERTGKAIDARVDERLDERALPPADRRAGKGGKNAMILGVWSMVLGIPATGAASAFEDDAGVIVALTAWAAIATINIMFNRRH